MKIERAWLHVFGAAQSTGEHVVITDGGRVVAILGESIDPESERRAQACLAALNQEATCTTSQPSIA